MATKLSPIQQAFLKQLFGPSMGRLKDASKAILGHEDYSDLLTQDFLDAIKYRGDQEINLNVPRALFVINQMLDGDPSQGFMSDKLHKVAMDVLDRSGLSKQERPSNSGATVGLVFLPAKKALQEAPDEPESEPQTNPFGF